VISIGELVKDSKSLNAVVLANLHQNEKNTSTNKRLENDAVKKSTQT
jgi:hypothetical protein